jgi:hypothetical protein
MLRIRLLTEALVVALAASVGPMVPGSDAAPPPLPTDETPTYAALPATDVERASIQRVLVSVMKSLPAPASGFRLAADGSSEEVGKMVLELGGGEKHWGPLDGSAERIYDRTDASDDEDRTLEVRVSINGTKGLSTGLASVGGTPRPFAVEGAFALEQTIVGVDDGKSGAGRVALPVDDAQADRTVALLRIYITPKALEQRLTTTAKGSEELPGFDSSFLPSSKRAALRSLVVEIHGQKRDVEAYARRVRPADLRRRLEG